MSPSSRVQPSPIPLQTKGPANHSKALLHRRRSAHGPSPLGRIVSMPPEPVSPKPLYRSPQRSGDIVEKENTSATSISASDDSLDNEAAKHERPSNIIDTPCQLAALGDHAAESNTKVTPPRKSDCAEDEDTREDELDRLIEEFRKWKLDMKNLAEDFKGQLDDLQEEFSKTLRAIPTDIVTMQDPDSVRCDIVTV